MLSALLCALLAPALADKLEPQPHCASRGEGGACVRCQDGFALPDCIECLPGYLAYYTSRAVEPVLCLSPDRDGESGFASEGDCLSIPNCRGCVEDNPAACALCADGYAPDAHGTVCREADCLFGPETAVDGCRLCRSDDLTLCAACFGQKAVTPDGKLCHGFTAAAWTGMLVAEFAVIACIVLYVIYCVVPRKPGKGKKGEKGGKEGKGAPARGAGGPGKSL